MKPNDTQAVVLSLDGIVYNIYCLLEKTFTSILTQHQLPIEPYFFELYVDGGYQNKHRSFIHYHLYEPHQQELEENFQTVLNQQIQNGSIIDYLNPSIEALIHMIQNKHYKLGLVSTLNRETSLKLIEKLPFAINYDVLVCGNEVFEGKPEKDIYSKIAKLLNTNKHQILAIDSSINGILASYLADMNNIFVQTYTKVNEKAKKYSSLQVKTLQDVLSII